MSESTAIIKHFNSINLSKDHKNWSPYKWCNEIESGNWDPMAIAIVISLKIPLYKDLFKWWSKWRLIKSKITAKDLIADGWEEGEALGKELKKLREIELKKL